MTTVFDSQLYLFEAVGTLISILNQIPDQQVVLLRAVLGPLATELQGNVRTKTTSLEDFQAVLQAHHLMMAAGNVAKGFPDLSMRSSTAAGAWVQVFREVTEQILTAAKAMDDHLIIRDAVSYDYRFRYLYRWLTIGLPDQGPLRFQPHCGDDWSSSAASYSDSHRLPDRSDHVPRIGRVAELYWAARRQI